MLAKSSAGTGDPARTRHVRDAATERFGHCHMRQYCIRPCLTRASTDIAVYTGAMTPPGIGANYGEPGNAVDVLTDNSSINPCA